MRRTTTLLVLWLMGACSVGMLAAGFTGGAEARASDVLTPELRCIEAAAERTVLKGPDAKRLCRGAVGTEPVACLRQAFDEALLSTPRAIQLCRCAPSTEPVRCFVEARDRPEIDDPEALRLCSPVSALRLSTDCRPIVPIEPR